MEKFAVDLDKVLDDFEFNEDHSTQNQSQNANTSLQSTNLPSQNSNIPPYYSPDLTIPPRDGNNRYYNRNEIISNFTNTQPNQDTAQHVAPYFEPSINHQPTQQNFEQIKSLTIPQNEVFSTEVLNQIWKPVESHPNVKQNYNNESNYAKQTNSTKKQSNISNVFNSLHEYINTDVTCPNQKLLSKTNNVEWTQVNTRYELNDKKNNKNPCLSTDQSLYSSQQSFHDKVNLSGSNVSQVYPEYNEELEQYEVGSNDKNDEQSLLGDLNSYIYGDEASSYIDNVNSLSKQLDIQQIKPLVDFIVSEQNENQPNFVDINDEKIQDNSHLIVDTLEGIPDLSQLNFDINSDTTDNREHDVNSAKLFSQQSNFNNDIIDFQPQTESCTETLIANDTLKDSNETNESNVSFINDKDEPIVENNSTSVDIQQKSQTETEEDASCNSEMKCDENLECDYNNENSIIQITETEKEIKEEDMSSDIDDDKNIINDVTDESTETKDDSNKDKILKTDLQSDYILEILKDSEKECYEALVENKYESNDQIIGFNNDIDISDSEVENYFQELEKEHQEDLDKCKERENDNEYSESITNESEENFINEPIINTKIETNEDNVENIEDNLNNEQIDNENIDKSNHNENSETVLENVCNDTVETLEMKQEFGEDGIVSEIEITETTKEDIEEKTVELNEIIESDAKIQEQEQVVPSNEIDVNGKTEIDVPKEEISESSASQECSQNKQAMLCRPNSLDLVSTSSDNTVEIAPPGQTPMHKINISEQQYNDNKIDETSKEVDEASNQTEESNKTEPTNETLSDVNPTDFSPSPSEVSSINDSILDDQIPQSQTGMDNYNMLGKRPPFWIPDSETSICMHCGFKFTVIKRRHHCRACGMVLCSKCCNMKLKLSYLDNTEARVCQQCYSILNKDVNSNNTQQDSASSDSATNSPAHSRARGGSQPNPNNPMEYCSTVPPLQQVENQGPSTPPSVMVPVGVLKRHGSTKSRTEKTVMFSDGIKPGCDLTELDNNWDSKPIRRQTKRVTTPPGIANKLSRGLPHIDAKTLCYVPSEDNALPPTVIVLKAEITYQDCSNNEKTIETLHKESLVFAIQRNFNVQLKIVDLECCVNKKVWCFSTQGLSSVGQDEIIILLEVAENETRVPKDIFLHLNNIYNDASKGNTITEMGFSLQNTPNFLGSKNHAGFLYIRPTYQCLQNIILPSAPYLIGILIHRWETPWVKIFPLRLLLRLGASYRYYPCPIISTREREALFVEIRQTIINLLADFRNFSYTLPSVRGLVIHMEERQTTVQIPKNRYDQVMRALNNITSEHILAFAGNFSSIADSHLVCIQDTNTGTYSTQAINIQNKPRKVTGASFIILNGALKTTSGLTAKSSIIEDGLMVQILPEQMVRLREALRSMLPFQISCGCVDSATSDETVDIEWTDNDVNFNLNVKSPIDSRPMDGIPSIRVHNGADHFGSSKFIRWTEVFIIQSGEENTKVQDPVDISKLSENISKATCQALVKFLDLLATNNFYKIAIRATLHSESVSYEAGSNGTKLAPIYMNSLDNELIPVLHNITSNNLGETAIVLELIFHILNL